MTVIDRFDVAISWSYIALDRYIDKNVLNMIINVTFFIGPRSDHSLPMSVTNWLTHWLTDKLVEDWMNKPKYAEYADYAD